MTELEIRDALACLMMLERDVEWWEEQGLSRVRPTLRDAWKAMQQLQKEVHRLQENYSELENHFLVVFKRRDELRNELKEARREQAESK